MSNHYEGMVVELRPLRRGEWQLVSIVEDKVVSHAVFHGDREVALSRAETLAGWFNANLVIHKLDKWSDP